MILGIDEVGRGPWAGPLVVGAVVLPDIPIDGLNDSKKLSAKKREALDVIIRNEALGYGLGWVHADEIDTIGLSAALVLATKRAVEQVGTSYHQIVIDGTINFLKDTTKGQYVVTLPKADALVPSVSAASIIAKVARDKYMTEQDLVHPGYSFARHVGYGTKTHRDAIEALGVTPLHRLSFAPLAKYRISQLEKTITTKSIGDRAEACAAKYLQAHDYEILERQWKTRYCEIDIIARRDDVIYIIEVKHRASQKQGGGMAAISKQKQAKLRLGAALYIARNKLDDSAVRILVITTTGSPPYVVDALEIE